MFYLELVFWFDWGVKVFWYYLCYLLGINEKLIDVNVINLMMDFRGDGIKSRGEVDWCEFVWLVMFKFSWCVLGYIWCVI